MSNFLEIVCKGFAVNNIDEDRDRFMTRIRNEKNVAISWLSQPSVPGPEFISQRYSSTIEVLSSVDLLKLIYSKLVNPFDKRSMSSICKLWCHLFYLDQWHYDITLTTKTSYGRCVISRDKLIVSKRCLCNKTDNILARRIVHQVQYQNLPLIDDDLELVSDHLELVVEFSPPNHNLSRQTIDEATEIAMSIIFPKKEVINIY